MLFGVFKNVLTKVPREPFVPFYEIQQNASSPTCSLERCRWFVTMKPFKWYLRDKVLSLGTMDYAENGTLSSA